MAGSDDAIVVGLGAMGSATLYQLAKRGLNALGIEMFQPGHDRGSSHGFHRLRAVLDRYLPGSSGPELRRITCMRTYTVDRDFVIDRHPGHESVVFGCGFSGRGDKFAPVVGEILTDLAIDGQTVHDIAVLAATRFSAAVAQN